MSTNFKDPLGVGQTSQTLGISSTGSTKKSEQTLDFTKNPEDNQTMKSMMSKPIRTKDASPRVEANPSAKEAYEKASENDHELLNLYNRPDVCHEMIETTTSFANRVFLPNQVVCHLQIAL